MKEVLDLFKAKDDAEFIETQLSEVHWNKNVLFINPQLNGRNFYKYILPYIVMFEWNVWGTAITGMEKYKPNKEYEHIEVPLNSRQILWADYIVVPFTTQDLKPLYEQLRSINPDIKIVFNVDFNYYKISKNHPLHEEFSKEESIHAVEDNIFYSDLTLVTNTKLSEFLIKKFTEELANERFKGLKTNVEIGSLPLLIDETIVMENVDIEPEPRTDNSLRVGIIATNYTWEDINSYKSLIKEAKDKLGDKITFVMLGFDGVDYQTGKSCFPESVNFEHVKPCTIVHYFKQFQDMHLDILFIPLRHNEFNMTSENYNKFLEAGLFGVPVMVYDIYPYSEIIKNGNNGIILKKKKEFVERLEHFEKNRDEIERMGKEAKKNVTKDFAFTKENISIIDKIFTKK